jgi:WD40 repeat protein
MNVTKAWAAQLDDYVIGLSWSCDGQLLAAASAAGLIGVFDSATGTRKHDLSGHTDGTNAVAFAPAVSGGARPELACGVADPELVEREPVEPVERADPGPHVVTGGVDPGLSLLASGGQDGKVRLWDAGTGQQVAEADTGRGAWVEHLQWRPASANPKSRTANPNMLAVTAGRKFLLLNPDGSPAHAFADAPKTLSALAWHPRGGAIAAASFGRVVVWDADDYRVQRDLPYGSAIEALVWSPDGRWLVAGAQDNAVHLWIPGEDQEFHMSGYETKVRELSFSSDSRWLATGGSRDACVWDCTGAGPEGREPVALPHADRVCAVAFQHARGLLATAAHDGEVALWSLDHGEARLAVVKLTTPPTTLAWSPDDTLLAIGSPKGGVLVLSVKS